MPKKYITREKEEKKMVQKNKEDHEVYMHKERKSKWEQTQGNHKRLIVCSSGRKGQRLAYEHIFQSSVPQYFHRHW